MAAKEEEGELLLHLFCDLRTFADLGGRMRGGVHFLQLLDRQMGVNLGGLQLGVPEHGLDEADVCAVFEHQRGGRMPEEVTAAALADVGPLHVLAHQLGQAVRGKGFPQVGQKERLITPGG